MSTAHHPSTTTYSVELVHPWNTALALTFKVSASNEGSAIRKARMLAESATGVDASLWDVGLLEVS